MIKLLIKRWYYILFAVAAITLQVVFDLKLPKLMSSIIDDGVYNSDLNLIKDIGIEMLLYTVYAVIATVIGSYFVSKLVSVYTRDLREKVYRKIESFSLEELNGFQISSLITRTTNDINQIQNLLTMLFRFTITAPLTATISIGYLVSSSIALSNIIFVAVVVLLIMVVILVLIVMPKFKLFQKAVDDLNLVTRENLSGLRVIKAFACEEYQEDKFDNSNKHLTGIYLFVNRIVNIMPPIMNLIMNITLLCVYWIGAYLVSKGDVTGSGQLMEAMNYGMQIIFSFLMTVMFFINLPRALVSISRVKEVIISKNLIVDSENSEVVKEKVKSITFDHVSFSYPEAEEKVLNDICFTANANEFTAFIGSTGSGKSTLINLIPRFYDITEGNILFNDKNVKDIQLKSLRDKIGLIPQKASLFYGTIKSNLSFGKKEPTEEEMREACEISCCMEFVDKLENKFDYHISQGGKNVSGGQRQRLSIARAVIKKPDIYIFDDSFSALDYKTDKLLRHNLNDRVKDSIFLVVAQRIGTIKNADKIIVLEDGKIVGIGKHEELMENCEVYRDIAYSQLTKEELNNA